MEQRDIPKFSALMVGIGELYGKTISSQLTDIYWLAMKKYDLQDVQKAFNRHVNNPDGGQFFPKPADIVRLLEGSGETKALQAWAKVERAIIQVGRYQSVVFDDPLIHAVIEDMGGWIKLCTIKNEDLPFRANEFQKRYMGFVLKNPNRYPKYLCGISEQENAKNGFECAAPVLIGDADKAVEVIKSGGGKLLEVQTLSQSIHEIMRQLPNSRGKGNKEDE
jgi:hypothetical protein